MVVKEFNLLIAGVGGQGVILLSELLGEAAVSDGLKVRGSEILGMAVRGGSVVSTIRFGNSVYGPLIPEGKGDLMIALEAAEALANIGYMSRKAIVILNTLKVIPVTVFLGSSTYPGIGEITQQLESFVSKIVTLDASLLAREAGSQLSANIVMLGAAFGTGKLPIKVETVRGKISERFPAQLSRLNLRAFETGYNVSRQAFTS